MLPRNAIEYWSRRCFIQDRIDVLSEERCSAARRQLNDLQSLGDASEVQDALNGLTHTDAIDLSLVLTDAVLEGILKGDDGKNLGHLLQWLDLTLDRTTSDESLKPFSKLLEGMYFHNDGDLGKAEEAYRDCLDNLDNLIGLGLDLPSVCFLCIAKLKADQFELQDASLFFEKALTPIDLETPLALMQRVILGQIDQEEALSQLESMQASMETDAWRTLVMEQQDISQRKCELAYKLLACTFAESVESTIALEKNLVDADLTQMLRNHTLALLNRTQGDDVLAAANMVASVEKHVDPEKDFLFEFAQFCSFRSRHELAEKVARSLLAARPGEDCVSVLLAQSLAQQAKHLEARQLLENVLQQDPNNQQAHSILGTIFVQTGDADRALEHLKVALRLDPNDAMAQHCSRLLQDDREASDEANDSLTVQIHPDMSGEQVQAAFIAGLIAHNPEARTEILDKVKNELGDGIAREVELILSCNGRVKLAASTLTNSFERAEEFFKKRSFEAAIEEYRNAIQENPDHALAYMGLGDCYFMTGEFETAAAYFEESLAIEPLAPTFRFLGDAHAQLGRYEQAIEAYERALEIDPTYELAAKQLEVVSSWRDTR